MKKTFLPAFIFSLLFLGAGCLGLGGPATPPQPKPVALQYWTTEEDNGALAPIITAYRKVRPQIDLAVTVLPKENYERRLLEALAENRGPDLMTIPSTWMRAWRTKLLAAPKELKIQMQIVDEKKNIKVADQTFSAVTIRDVRNNYVDAVATDVILFGDPPKENSPAPLEIYGLPLSLDTPALFYNKDLLRRTKLEEPPKTWEEVRQLAGSLTVKDEAGNITLSGAALGEAANIPYAADILAALMLQNGSVMAAPEGYVMLDRSPPDHSGYYPPAVDALLFYTGFAVPDSANYSWNDTLPNAFDAFTSGKTALFVGFPTDTARIRAIAPRLDFGIAPLPQVNAAKPANVTRYPIETISKKTQYPNEAWDFLQFLSKPENAGPYLAATKRPTALRSLISSQQADPDLAPFVSQVFTAKSWYKGRDYAQVEQVFADLINFELPPGDDDYTKVLRAAANRINEKF